MRKDMGRVIIDTGRYCWGYPYRNKGRTARKEIYSDGENDHELWVKTTAKWLYKTKMLNDCLRPLWRYLESRVGDPWNDVWSDVCRSVKGKIDSHHVRQHVKDYVDTQFRYKRTKYSWGLYVDEEGILRK